VPLSTGLVVGRGQYMGLCCRHRRLWVGPNVHCAYWPVRAPLKRNARYKPRLVLRRILALLRILEKNLMMTGAMASPGFVARRRGKDGNYVTEQSRWTSGRCAAAARWLNVLCIVQYWWKELTLVWIVDICNS